MRRGNQLVGNRSLAAQRWMYGDTSVRVLTPASAPALTDLPAIARQGELRARVETFSADLDDRNRRYDLPMSE